jgi:L-2-hydroxyglutarate oxidase LhgO
MDATDCIVIGAGVVGLAVARALARRGREVIVLEAADAFGTGVSSRNSEVIHAGIYYPAGSLKARFCVEGRELLYQYCAARGVQHQRCGKLIVATSYDQIADLQKIREAAYANGVALSWLDRDEAVALEPTLQCVAALHSTTTGIVDSHGYMLALLGDAEAHGATLACRARVGRMWLQSESVLVAINGDSRPEIRARTVINCASLHATEVARAIEDFPEAHAPATRFARGHYFTLVGRSPFTRLIYPVPEPGGLGVHLTLDLAGQARFGPDVEWVQTLDYSVSMSRAERFYGAIRRFWPQLNDGQLVAAYAGIRPKLHGPGDPPADFMIEGHATHGVRGIINLFGIESPGLTASLAIADHVAELAEQER